MNKRHFEHMAAIVKAIHDGKWSHTQPEWVGPTDRSDEWRTLEISDELGNLDINIVRAIMTAEAFINLASQWNPLFDRTRFLYACGLGPKPQPKKRNRA